MYNISYTRIWSMRAHARLNQLGIIVVVAFCSALYTTSETDWKTIRSHCYIMYRMIIIWHTLFRRVKGYLCGSPCKQIKLKYKNHTVIVHTTVYDWGLGFFFKAWWAVNFWIDFIDLFDIETRSIYNIIMYIIICLNGLPTIMCPPHIQLFFN